MTLHVTKQHCVTKKTRQCFILDITLKSKELLFCFISDRNYLQCIYSETDDMHTI